MIQKNFFEKHYPRLVTEGILRSAFFGLLIGFGVNFLAALAAWLFDFGGIWFAIGVGAGAALISAVVLYFARFRPTAAQVARRVDRLGLEERLVTMLELQEDDSYIARLQREDAKKHLGLVANRRVRLRLSRVVIVFAIVAALFGSSMTTVVGLAENDIIPSGSDMMRPDDALEKYIMVSYIAEEGGEIFGETDQLLLPGEDATTVVAMPEDGWTFEGWSDGVKNPERTDLGVTDNLEITALFSEMEDGDGESGEPGGESDQNGQKGEGDKAEDVPSGNETSSEGDSSDGGDEGDGNNSDGNNEDGKGESDEQGQNPGDGKGAGGGGKWADSNQFIDGNTYYKDQMDAYYEWAQQIFEEGGEIPPELRDFFETYIDSI